MSKTRSGVEENHDERPQFLCYICSHIDDDNERIVKERNQMNKAELDLTSTGADMRSKAMNRRRPEQDKLGSMDLDSTDTPSAKMERRRLHRIDGTDEFGDGISELLVKRLESESGRREVEERRVSLEEKSFELKLKKR
jgi:hypothetical protein